MIRVALCFLKIKWSPALKKLGVNNFPDQAKENGRRIWAGAPSKKNIFQFLRLLAN